MVTNSDEVIGSIVEMISDNVFFPTQMFGKIVDITTGNWPYILRLYGGQYNGQDTYRYKRDEFEVLDTDDPRMVEYMLWIMKH
jgi:hypothetical protein